MYFRNSRQRSILAIKGTLYEKRHFFEKGAQKISPPPYSITLISVLHENKALHNFCKRGQHSIVECNIGLEYALIWVKNIMTTQKGQSQKKISQGS